MVELYREQSLHHFAALCWYESLPSNSQDQVGDRISTACAFTIDGMIAYIPRRLSIGKTSKQPELVKCFKCLCETDRLEIFLQVSVFKLFCIMWVGFCIHLRCLRWSSRTGRRRWLNFSFNLAHERNSGGLACFCRTLLQKEYKRCVVLVEIGFRPEIFSTMKHFVHTLRVEWAKNSNLLLSTANSVCGCHNTSMYMD
jgi:hypothetical protein